MSGFMRGIDLHNLKPCYSEHLAALLPFEGAIRAAVGRSQDLLLYLPNSRQYSHAYWLSRQGLAIPQILPNSRWGLSVPCHTDGEG